MISDQPLAQIAGGEGVAYTFARYRLLGTGIGEDAALITRECFVSAADDVLVEFG